MSQSSVAIRRATPDDFERTSDINEESDALHREHLEWLFQAPDGNVARRRVFNERLRNPEAALFVAEAGPVIGAASVVLRTAPDLETFIPQQWAVLDYVVVKSSWRGRGVGTALIRAAEVWANETGVKWIELSVYDFNAGAKRLYERLGYGPISTQMRKPFLSTD